MPTFCSNTGPVILRRSQPRISPSEPPVARIFWSYLHQSQLRTSASWARSDIDGCWGMWVFHTFRVPSPTRKKHSFKTTKSIKTHYLGLYKNKCGSQLQSFVSNIAGCVVIHAFSTGIQEVAEHRLVTCQNQGPFGKHSVPKIKPHNQHEGEI